MDILELLNDDNRNVILLLPGIMMAFRMSPGTQ